VVLCGDLLGFMVVQIWKLKEFVRIIRIVKSIVLLLLLLFIEYAQCTSTSITSCCRHCMVFNSRVIAFFVIS